ncbi:hypothetical protein Nepgr_013715 [Nepenthes gracilis]|uniref:beta-galactosidase n=1 Tax=Nepenthes gracilis TaxID=150966 RepID=A0AAD3SJE8_NEPGR|nr:hypothetical protein Nepgr_013715 [Nepenthes gracilis]
MAPITTITAPSKLFPLNLIRLLEKLAIPPLRDKILIRIFSPYYPIRPTLLASRTVKIELPKAALDELVSARPVLTSAESSGAKALTNYISTMFHGVDDPAVDISSLSGCSLSNASVVKASVGYDKWVARMVVGLRAGVPWVMCNQDDFPDPIINTCNGFYYDYFSPNKDYKPKIWTEAWTGWFTDFGGPVPGRPAKNLAFAVTRFIHKGGSFINYYMCHGGTTSGRTTGSPFIATSYGYDAPLNEYGLIRHSKWGHLIELHRTIKLCEPTPVFGDPSVILLRDVQETHVFKSNSGYLAAFLANYDRRSYAKVAFGNSHYNLPPRSFSILPDCINTVYNTARVGVNLRPGLNKISLLSIVVGLLNVGSHFKTWNAGILSPVSLNGLNEGKRDLTWQKWSYKIGLRGESLSLPSLTGASTVKWLQGVFVSQNQPLIWYKTTFNAPAGDNPLALDMGSMGKGQVWINGKSIGRYWPTYKASGAYNDYNYAGYYNKKKCLSCCGLPSHRCLILPPLMGMILFPRSTEIAYRQMNDLLLAKHCSSTSTADMNKETVNAAKLEECTFRLTRARAKDLGTARRQIQKPPRQDQKRVVRANYKREASDENKPAVGATVFIQNKRRAVLNDVTNVSCGKSYTACFNGTKIQTRKQAKRAPMRNIKVAPGFPEEILDDLNVKEKISKSISKLTGESQKITSPSEGKTAGDTSKLTVEPRQLTLPVKLEQKLPLPFRTRGNGCLRECFVASPVLVEQGSKRPRCFGSLLKKDHKLCEKSGTSNDPGIVDIDSNFKDPQMCSLYAPDIYNNIRVTELNQRPSTNYMETVQRDITESMRGILIDWLVEVSEEYKLVPDTLYLTTSLIDRFLSQVYIEKQRLQLLGVSCMLIASKYEEICAPRVEEFCFITDNTYTREEVLKMESQVLNFLCFQLSVPTTKTFLRRFVQAAQATDKVPSFDLELLANYLAELTLTDYRFLKYLPSLVAASAVFLARWTLDQSVHPWNPTLEHYTCYKAPDLKVTVMAMQDLQSNINGCKLNAIREKYKQQKFNKVGNLSSPKPIQSLF